MTKTRNFEGSESFFRVTLISILVSGAVFFWANLSHWTVLPDWREPVARLFEAIFIAMVLALTVDTFLKQGLIRDAFKASIGYILPRYLQDELAAVYSNEVICEEHDQIVTLTPIANDLICVTLRVQRKLRNISGNNHAFIPMLTVEEWLATSAHSKIHEVGYRKNGGVDVLPEKEVILHEGAIPKLALHLPGTTMMPNDTIDLWFSFDEIKHRSDMHVLRFRYSTNNPRVRIDAPPEIGWKVEFTHRLDGKNERYGNTTVLPGLLLPYHCIFVRWWEKSSEENWRKTHNSQVCQGAIARPSAPMPVASDPR